MKINTVPLSQVEVGYPLFAQQTAFALIEKVEIVPNKAGTGNNLLVITKLVDGQELALHEDGELREAKNLRYTTYIGLTPTEKYTEEMIAQKCKQLAVAVGFEGDDLETEHLVGQYVKVRLDVEVDTTGKYEPSNKINRFYPIKEEDGFNV